MKFINIITTVALFTGVYGASSTTSSSNSTSMSNSTAFNVTSLNGTWYVEGLQSSVMHALTKISKVINVTVSCPQVLVLPAENSTMNNTLYVQPSILMNWYNATAHKQQNTNISLSGLMTLNTTNSTEHASFNVSFAIPPAVKEIMDNEDSMPTFDADAFTAGNVSEPLPNGADYTGFIDVTLGSSNGTANDVLLFKAYNFTTAENDTSSTQATSSTTNEKRAPKHEDEDEDEENEYDDAFYGILTHENVTASGNSTNFNETVTSLGGDPSEFAQFNYTCSA